MEQYRLIRDLTGKGLVYPGHPLVVATVIMQVFPDFEAANAPTPNGWCAALGNSRIPGAGDHVGAAVRVLEIGASGGSVEDMVEYACNYWMQGQAGGHVDNVEAGVAQAAAIKPHFEAAAATWFASVQA